MNKLILLLCLISFNAEAVVYKIWWGHPTEREDNTALSMDEIAEYHVYYTDAYGGELFKTFKTWGVVGERGYMAWWEPKPRDFCLVMTTIDTDGRESLYSPEKCFITDDPNAPVIQCQ